jgi:hypothetical protein
MSLRRVAVLQIEKMLSLMLTPIGASRQVFERAGEPQKFVMLPCGHFVPYSENFAQSNPAARDGFVMLL